MLALLFVGSSVDFSGAVSLQNASVRLLSLAGNDLVFDATRGVLYLSVPSSAGLPYGNSVVTVDPASGEIVHSTFIGSEPDRLAISADGSRVYVGVDGADCFCWWEPGTDTVGPLTYFTAPFGFGPFNAADFAINPTNSHLVVVSKDDISSTAAGDLELFQDDVSLQEMNLIYGAESIGFSDGASLIGFNNEDTGYDLWKWAFDGNRLTQTQHVMGVIAGFNVKIKIRAGLIFSDEGRVVAASNLSPLGTFSGLPSSPVVEPSADMKTVYFLGGGSYFGGNLQLVCFDRQNYIMLDSKTFTNALSSVVRSFYSAGKDNSGNSRFAFVQANGQAGIITVPPPVLKIQTFQSDGFTSQLAWSSELERAYEVQWSFDLTNWSTFLTTNATQPRTAVTFNPRGGTGREFYRVVGN